MSFAITKYRCSMQVCSISKHLVFSLDFTQWCNKANIELEELPDTDKLCGINTLDTLLSIDHYQATYFYLLKYAYSSIIEVS